jgi:hypothetical protein
MEHDMESQNMPEELRCEYPPDPVSDNPDRHSADSAPRRIPAITLTFSKNLESPFRLVPIDLTRRHKILPFGVDKDHKTVSIACAKPDDPVMVTELSALLQGMNIHYYLADPESIESLIDQLSQRLEQPDSGNRQINPSSVPMSQEMSQQCEAKPDVVMTNAAPLETTANQLQLPPEPKDPKVVLFITQSGKISPHLMFSLNAERFVPRIVNSAEMALAVIQTQSVSCIFIEKGHGNKCELLAQKLREFQPAVAIRYYTTEAALLLNDTADDLGQHLFQKNLQLLCHLTDKKSGSRARHASAVAHLADAISARLNLPGHLRQTITTAACLHSIAEEDLNSADGYNQSDIIGLSAGRLAGWDYPAMVIQMLRVMYHETSTLPEAPHSLDKLGGGILTAADCFCHTWPDACSLSARQIGHVEEKLRELVGKQVGEDTLAALIDVVRDEMSARMLCHSRFRVHVFLSRGVLSADLESAFNGADLATSTSQSLDECAASCRQSAPGILLIHDSGPIRDVYDVIIGLTMRDVPINQLNTILLVNGSTVTEAVRLFRHGVEDVLPADADPAAIVAKIERIKTRIDDSTKQRLDVLRELGTHGSLEDMNLVDLLEIWKTNKRPVRISVTAHANQLTIFVDRGRIIHAECLDGVGTDAILKGMAWKVGAWNIDSVDSSELPAPNVDQDIDSVLLEACVRLDNAAQLN